MEATLKALPHLGHLWGLWPVHVEVGNACEAFAAQLTAVGLLAGVRAPVLGEVRAVTEAAAALGAWEGPLAGVDALVHHQV